MHTRYRPFLPAVPPVLAPYLSNDKEGAGREGKKREGATIGWPQLSTQHDA